MVLSNPVDWSEKYAAIYTWAANASGWTTRWADQDEARPDYPYVLLDIVSVAKEGGIDEINRTVDLRRVRDVTVTPDGSTNPFRFDTVGQGFDEGRFSAPDGTVYEITINGTAFQHVLAAGDAVADIVDALVAAINGGAEPVAATDGATELEIAGDGETSNPTTPRLWSLTVDGPLTWVNNDEGNEIEVRATGSRVVTLNVQTFERNTRTDNPGNDPTRNAFNMMARLQASLGLPSVQAQLYAADIALIEELPVTDLSAKVEDTMLSRASMDVRFRTLSSLSEYTGYISELSGVATYGGAPDSPITDTLSVAS